MPFAEPVAESLFAFQSTWARLAERTHLVAVDLPGSGHSQRSEALLSPQAMARFRQVRATLAAGDPHRKRLHIRSGRQRLDPGP